MYGAMHHITIIIIINIVMLIVGLRQISGIREYPLSDPKNGYPGGPDPDPDNAKFTDQISGSVSIMAVFFYLSLRQQQATTNFMYI